MTDPACSAQYGTSLGSTSAAPDLAALGSVRGFVDRIAKDAQLPEQKAFDLKVAVSEACANAIEHATRRASAIEIEAWSDRERLTISILSQSNFHQPGCQTGDARRHRGFGLPLMVSLTDEVCISRERGGGLRVNLSVNLEDD